MNKSIMDKLKTFGQTIRDFRESKGLLLCQLAVALEVDPAFTSKMERDEKQSARSHVEILAVVLKMESNWLFTNWLSDKLLTTIAVEPSAFSALKLTEKRLKTIAN